MANTQACFRYMPSITKLPPPTTIPCVFATLSIKGERAGRVLSENLHSTKNDVLSLGFGKSLKELGKMTTTRDLARVLFRGAREYFELVGEVIFEMAFDNILRYDKDARPWGGGEAFLTVMTMSILTSAAMRAMGTHGVKTLRDTDGSVVMKASRARLILPTLALSLQMSMLVMRIPVMLGNMR